MNRAVTSESTVQLYSPLAKEFWFGGSQIMNDLNLSLAVDNIYSLYTTFTACTQHLIEYSICTSVVLDIFINRSTDQMNSDFGGVLSPIFRSEYGQSIQMQYICVSFLAKSQLRERGVCKSVIQVKSRDQISFVQGCRLIAKARAGHIITNCNWHLSSY